jgi:hypothetical protein
MTRKGSSYKAYKLVSGLKMPRSTRYYQRKKRENNARKISDLEFAQKIINNFVEQFSSIYSDASMLSGVHELLHLVECTQYLGPLNLIILFPYEDLNRKCIGVIHGRDLMGEELIKMFSLIQSLSSTVREFDKNSELNDFIKKICYSKQAIKKG